MSIISESIKGTIIEVLIQSSNIKAAKYDTESKKLLIFEKYKLQELSKILIIQA